MRDVGRFRRSVFFAVVLVSILVLLPTAFAVAKSKQCKPVCKGADTILVNGKIITVDRHDSVAQAVAIRGGKIIAVGRNWCMAPYLRKGTEIINLHGRTATPGMIDSHVHFQGSGALYWLDLSVLSVDSLADVAAKVEAQAAAVGPGEWVLGRNWAAAHLAEHRPIYATDIDAASPDNPVFLLEASYHQATVNSYVLDMLDITASTPDPPGGIIDRYPDGTPTGLLKESAAWMVYAYLPEFSAAQEKEGLEYLTKEASRRGLTSILYPGIGDVMWQTFKDVYAEGNLTVRSAMLWSGGETVEDAQALVEKIKPFTHPSHKNDDMLWSQGVKMFMDGVQDASTHWSWQEHWINFTEVNPGWYGLPVIDPDLYRQLVKVYHDAGLQVQTHSIGDRAIDWVLGSYKAAEKDKPIYGLRHGIIHCDLPTDWALKTMRKMQKRYDAGYVYTNPDFMWWTEIIAAAMGPEMSLREMPYKTYEKLGIHYGFGTDWPVDPLDPKYSIWSAMTRDTLVGLFGEHPFGLDECINVHQALRAATRSNAYLLYMEDKIGSIEVGKYADIAVWDKNWYKATTDEIFNINCEMTILGGETVYMAEDTPITVQ
jgi:predicted amidohydrolase YtcJ